MAKKSMVRKAFVNKRNKQISFTVPKKQLKAIDPTIKFSEDLFIDLARIKFFNKRRKK